MIKAISPSMIKFELINGFSKAVLLLWIVFVSYALCLSAVLSCLFLVVLWSPAGIGLTSWLLFVLCFLVFCHFPKCILVHIRIKGEVGALNLVKVLQWVLMTVPRQCFFVDLFVICYTFVFSGARGQERYFLPSLPDICLLHYFYLRSCLFLAV